MKKILTFAVFVFCSACFAQAGPGTIPDKQAILQKILANSARAQQMSAEFEIGITLMGNSLKIPGKIWRKGDMFRMESVMAVPNIGQVLHTTVVSDGNTIYQFNNLSRKVTEIDLTKLPAAIRSRIQQQVGFVNFGLTAGAGNGFLKSADVSEVSKNGKNFYAVTINNPAGFLKNLPAEQQQMAAFAKKVVCYVDEKTYEITRVEIYGDSPVPFMWIDFNSFSDRPIPDSIFKYTPPPGVQIVDNTGTVMQMFAENAGTETGTVKSETGISGTQPESVGTETGTVKSETGISGTQPENVETETGTVKPETGILH